MTTQKPFQLGSISTGTLNWLRNGDSCAPCECGHVNDGHCCSRCCDCPDCESDRFETQQELCPPFVYFGAHPGDGADFGFFVDWSALDNAIWMNGGLLCHELTIDSSCIIEHKNGSAGQWTLMDLNRQILWSV